MEPIKLLQISDSDGVIRFQSQLLVGSDTADFIMDGNVLKHYSYGNRGFNFYETDIPYEIVKNKEDMSYQAL